MGYIRKTTGIDLTGGGQEDAARESARIQTEGGAEAIEFGEEQLGGFRQGGLEAFQQLPGATFGGFDRDPSRVLDNPLFKALARKQEQDLIGQRATLGLGGSGGTRDALQRNLLLLGSEFQEKDLDRQLQENQTRFGQLFQTGGVGANAAGQLAASGQNILTDSAAARSGVPIVAGNVAFQQGQNFLDAVKEAPKFFATGGVGG
jgi:hypothetical protein